MFSKPFVKKYNEITFNHLTVAVDTASRFNSSAKHDCPGWDVKAKANNVHKN